MKKWITLLLCLITLSAAQAKPTALSPEQLEWIKHHPDVTYTVSDRWPQDFRVNGHPVGLSQSVLQGNQRLDGAAFQVYRS
jgi:two-component system sensor histidine kinase EvgS